MSLYVYDLPDQLIQAIKAYTGEVEYKAEMVKSVDMSVANSEANAETSDWTPGVCSVCGKFEGDTRSHYKMDYHRYNIKRKLKNLPILSEKQFDDTIGDLDESISGSDSDLSEIEEKSDNENGDANSKITHSRGSPLMLFDLEEDGLRTAREILKTADSKQRHRSKSPSSREKPHSAAEEKTVECLAVYKPILDDLDRPMESLLKLKSLKNSHSVILMIGGGHFSGAVISHTPTKQVNNAANPCASINILEHKTFHRYTTRRKQGGSQSASDSAKGKANSAGSSLRRHNQTALEKEVRELIISWTNYINTSVRIYIRATGKENRAALMNFEKSPIISSDPRIKSIPITTKRATGTEIKRCWKELTTAQIVPRPVIAVKAKVVKDNSRGASPMPSSKKPVVPVLTPQEKHTQEIISLIKKGKAPKLLAYFKTNELPVDFEFEPANHALPNALFYVSAHGHKPIVSSLLLNKADPTRQNNNEKTAYELAADEGVREAFQVVRHEHPDMCDWKLARVGPPISREEAELRKKMSEVELAKNLAKEKAEKVKKLKQQFKEDNPTPSSLPKGRLLSTTQESSLSGLSNEARMKLERERRARAAEARFKR